MASTTISEPHLLIQDLETSNLLPPYDQKNRFDDGMAGCATTKIDGIDAIVHAHPTYQGIELELEVNSLKLPELCFSSAAFTNPNVDAAAHCHE